MVDEHVEDHPAARDREVEALIKIARTAREASRESNFAALAELYARVRATADSSRGWARELYEVAEAFLRVLAPIPFSRDTLALVRFLGTGDPAAAHVLASAASLQGLPVATLSTLSGELRSATDELVRMGVLKAERDVLTVRAGLRPVARDLVEPPLLRMWKHVQAQRERLAMARGLPEPQRPPAFAAMLGITEAQAAVYLRDFPVHGATTAESVSGKRSIGGRTLYRRESPRRVLSSAETRTALDPVPVGTSDVATASAALSGNIPDEPEPIPATTSRGAANEITVN